MAVRVRDVSEPTPTNPPRPGVAARTRRRSAGPTVKVTITVPAEVLERAKTLVRKGHARSLSDYISEALAAQVAADEGEGGLDEFLDQLDAELGPPSEADFAWARAALGL